MSKPKLLPLNGNENLDSYEPLDQKYVEEELKNPKNRFVAIPGVLNVRTLGRLPATQENNKRTTTRELYFYRSSAIHEINTLDGKRALEALNIKYVFDLRSNVEGSRQKKDNPSIEGVCRVSAPVFSGCFLPDYNQYVNEEFDDIYSEILEKGGESFQKVSKHIIDKPVDEGGFLFHCSAGKDRTAVLAALLLKLAGVSDTDIAYDYALTRIGREPGRAKLMAALDTIPFFNQYKPESDREKAKAAMVFCKKEYMFSFLEILSKRFKGVEEYMKIKCNLMDAEVKAIKEKLVAPRSNHGC